VTSQQNGYFSTILYGVSMILLVFLDFSFRPHLEPVQR